MISLHDAVKKIHDTKWTLTSNFYVLLEPTNKSQKLWTECGLPTSSHDDLNLYIKDFILPQIGSGSPVETFVNNRYRLAHGVFDPVVINLTFKDFESLKLYRSFVKYTYESKLKYPDEYLINLRVFKIRDHQQGANMPDSFEVMSFDKCIIKTVSQVTLSNDNEPQIAEFTIEIKTSREPTIGKYNV